MSLCDLAHRGCVRVQGLHNRCWFMVSETIEGCVVFGIYTIDVVVW